MNSPTNVLTIADQETLAPSGVITKALDLNSKEGFASLQINTVGSGVVQAQYRLSNDVKEPALDSKLWIDGVTDIVTAHSAGSALYPMPSEAWFARYLQIVLTETTTTDSVVIDSWLATQ